MIQQYTNKQVMTNKLHIFPLFLSLLLLFLLLFFIFFWSCTTLSHHDDFPLTTINHLTAPQTFPPLFLSHFFLTLVQNSYYTIITILATTRIRFVWNFHTRIGWKYWITTIVTTISGRLVVTSYCRSWIRWICYRRSRSRDCRNW